MAGQRRIVGVLGGKGPEATAELLRLIIRNTPAESEEEHLRIIIDNNPQIPKPSLGITGQGRDPLPALTETARNLERAGADFIVIPCNSAHYYIEDLRGALGIPVVSLIDETAAAVRAAGCRTAGLLATPGLTESGIYQAAFEKAGIAALVPGRDQQAELMAAILAFKDGGPKAELGACAERVAAGLVERGAGGLVLGCTELPVALAGTELPVPCFDTLEILALAAVREATGAGTKESDEV